MAKEKIFTAEDFDKPKSFWKKNKGWLIGVAALLIAAIVLCCVLYGKTGQKGEDVAKQDIDTVQTTVTPTETGAVESPTSGGYNEVETEIPTHPHSPSVETPKTETETETENESVAAKPSPEIVDVSDDVEQEAMKVIRGDYGNVPERREKLGGKYQVIQNRVNQLKKDGVF